MSSVLLLPYDILCKYCRHLHIITLVMVCAHITAKYLRSALIGTVHFTSQATPLKSGHREHRSVTLDN